jgi:hypothetical protein
MIAAGKWESRTGASKVDDETVNEVMEWEAKARSLIMNSACRRSVTIRVGKNKQLYRCCH